MKQNTARFLSLLLAAVMLLGEGVTNGMTKTSFAPEETCERAEAVTFLFRVNELENLASVRPA